MSKKQQDKEKDVSRNQAEDAPPDIEHVVVHDDPRKWSRGRKRFTLATVSCASLLLTLAVSIYNPAINDIIKDLHTSYQIVSWSLSIHALITGCTPLLWGAFSELYGRKTIYLISIALFILGSGVAGSAKNIGTLIGMRVIQAIGGSAVLTIGAATLADIYDPKERGSVMGLYYAAPLLGPSLGPIIGGAATALFSWRATFYFLAIFGGVSLIAFIFFKDTFRRERSLSYQNALKHVHRSRAAVKSESESEASTGAGSGEDTSEKPAAADGEPLREEQMERVNMNLTLRQMQIVRPLIQVVRRVNNICILIASGLIYGGITYCLSYTSVKTFGGAPYDYNSLKIGLVLLAFGVGNMVGSLLGGRWSDYTHRKYQKRNGGVSRSEDRLHSTKIMMPVLPASLLAYAWMADRKVNIALICVALFFVGFSSLWIYSSTLAYIVDANVGRSSSAVAVNSFFRGLAAFIAAEIAIPLQNALGDGGMYTLIAGVMLLECGLILLIIAKGAKWREDAEDKENRRSNIHSR